MNCICCMDNFDYFTQLSGFLRKKLTEHGLSSDTVIISPGSDTKLPWLSPYFDSCIIISDTASGIVNINAERSALIMPYETVTKDPCGIKNISLITLGMGSRSTICCSSMLPGRTMVSLQRSIKNFYDEKIEPAEFFLLTPQEQSQYTSMAWIAVKLLMTRTAESI